MKNLRGVVPGAFSRKKEPVRTMHKLVAGFFLGFLVLATVRGQEFSGITGVVLDNSGAVVAGVNVALDKDAVNLHLEATTSAEGTYQFMNDPEKGMALFKHRLKQDNAKALEQTYKYFAPKFSFPVRVSHNGMQNTLELIANENPKLDTKLEKYLDESIMDELEKEGFFKRISK